MDHASPADQESRMMRAARQPRRERRWIVLGEDGRHVTLGRHSDLTEAEIAAAEQALAAQGLHGWLAVAAGDYWARRGRVSLLMVRPLGTPQAAFDEAAAAFEALRRRALQPA
jgi:hypothetical protein